MSGSYSVLAKYYDKFSLQDCDYIGWSQYLLQIAFSHNVKSVAELACGTGKMTKLLAESGLDVTAVDVSCEMLSEAVSVCSATFVRQDMRKLKLLRPADMAVCVNDGVNYLKPAELPAFFKTVADNLKSGAPFVFDVSSEYKLTKVIGNNVFYDDYDEATLLWTNKLGANSVQMDITLFEKQGDIYKRADERHVQYVHRRSDTEQALLGAGFSVEEVSSDYGKPLKTDSQRLTFYAIKRS